MSELKDNVIMPSSDYQAICDAVREKTRKTQLFRSGELAKEIAGIETDKAAFSDFSYFCYNGARVDELSEVDTSECTNFSNMFVGCKSLTTIPELNTSSGTDFNCMFAGCSNLTTIPALDTSKGTNFSAMFNGCSNLTPIPELNTSKGTNFSAMFVGCRSLTTIPALDVSKGTNFSNMFSVCSSLTSVPALDTSSGTNFGGMFQGCSSLTNLILLNIRKSMDISPSTSLTVDSLVNTIKELCTVSSTQTLTMGSTNLAKIADLYCRVTGNTTEKKPMELCESADEGAMTLAAYAALKNWSIK